MINTRADDLAEIRELAGRPELDTNAAERLANLAAGLARGEYRPPCIGWRNWETWNLALWIYNDEEMQEEAARIVHEELEIDYPDDQELDRRARIANAGSALEAWIEESFDESWIDQSPPSTGPVADAWTYTLHRIDWDELARSLAEEP